MKTFKGSKKSSLSLAFLILFNILFMVNLAPKKAYAAVSYPYQEVKFVGSTGKNINIQGYPDNSLINLWQPNGYSNERWRFSTTDGVNFKIINMTTNTLLSPKNWSLTSGTSCVLFSDSSRDEQLWNIIGVDQDVNGDYYNYKIVNKSNTNMALTEDAANSLVNISTYSGAANQKWKLDCSGLVGFAGYSKDPNGQNKTGTIGGLLGTTIFVTDYASFKSALADTNPKTIVVAANIDCGVEPVVTRIASNKTIIGAYGTNVLTDPFLQTNDPYHVHGVANNIIFKNLDIEVKNKPNIMSIAVYGSRNVWIDHCTFNSSLNIDVNEVGKFIWLNYSDYTNTDIDYITISYCKFYHRYWAVTFGASSTTKNNATVAYNYFDSCVRRTPETGNGRLHALNNFIKRPYPEPGNSNYAAIIGAYEAHTYSEANRFENFYKPTGYWDIELQSKYVKDVGSYTNSGITPTATPHVLATPLEPATTFNPATKYNYKVIKAYDSSAGNDVKKFCTTYAGAVSSYSNLKYVDYYDVSSYLN